MPKALVKSYSLSSPRSVESPSISISDRRSAVDRRHKTILEIKKATSLQVINNPTTYKIFKDFKFQPCLEPNIRSLKNVPNFYKEMIKNWAKCFSCSPYLPSDSFPVFMV